MSCVCTTVLAKPRFGWIVAERHHVVEADRAERVLAVDDDASSCARGSRGAFWREVGDAGRLRRRRRGEELRDVEDLADEALVRDVLEDLQLAVEEGLAEQRVGLEVLLVAGAVAVAGGELEAVDVLGVLGDEVGDAEERVGAPEHAARAGHHLDALDGLERLRAADPRRRCPTDRTATGRRA